MDKIKQMLPFLSVNILPFYIAPLIFISLKAQFLLITTLILVFPLLCFTETFMYSTKYKNFVIYSIIVTITFIPTIYIFYNSSAYPYAFIYGSISLISGYIGSKRRVY